MKVAISRFVVVAAIAALVVVCGVTPVLAQSPSFTDFHSVAGLTLNGNAANVSTTLQLTDKVANQTGSAWFNTPQPFANGFDTTFTFQLTGGTGADGIAFVIQNAPTSPLHAIGYTGGNGGALGYGGDDGNSQPGTGIPASVAFEFDTYQNGWDMDANHVAVQSCGALPNTSHHVSSCPATGGANIDPRHGYAASTTSFYGTHAAEIKYNPPSTSCAAGAVCNNLFIYVDQQQVLAVAVDLTSLIGSVPAYVGFTGATGGNTNIQNIQAWTYNPFTVVTGTQIDPNNPQSLSQSTILNNAPGKHVEFGFDFSSVPNLQLQGGTTPFIGFSGMTPAAVHSPGAWHGPGWHYLPDCRRPEGREQ